MTTIAYRNGIIAADGLATRNGIVVETKARKIRRLANGDIVGLTGDACFLESFIEWHLDRSKDRFDLGESSGIVLNSSGLFEYEIKCDFSQVHDEFAAWGSGFAIAIAAMTMGASAVEAVELAAKLDIKTGGEIISLSLEAAQNG